MRNSSPINDGCTRMMGAPRACWRVSTTPSAGHVSEPRSNSSGRSIARSPYFKMRPTRRPGPDRVSSCRHSTAQRISTRHGGSTS